MVLKLYVFFFFLFVCFFISEVLILNFTSAKYFFFIKKQQLVNTGFGLKFCIFALNFFFPKTDQVKKKSFIRFSFISDIWMVRIFKFI